jgi:hypothetical protein
VNYTLSEADVSTLKALIGWWRKQPNRPVLSHSVTDKPNAAPDFYVVQALGTIAPNGGIGDCYIKRTYEGVIIDVSEHVITCTNLLEDAVNSGAYAFAQRDKFGVWQITCLIDGPTVGTGSGTGTAEVIDLCGPWRIAKVCPMTKFMSIVDDVLSSSNENTEGSIPYVAGIKVHWLNCETGETACDTYDETECCPCPPQSLIDYALANGVTIQAPEQGTVHYEVLIPNVTAELIAAWEPAEVFGSLWQGGKGIVAQIVPEHTTTIEFSNMQVKFPDGVPGASPQGVTARLTSGTSTPIASFGMVVDASPAQTQFTLDGDNYIDNWSVDPTSFTVTYCSGAIGDTGDPAVICTMISQSLGVIVTPPSGTMTVAEATGYLGLRCMLEFDCVVTMRKGSCE